MSEYTYETLIDKNIISDDYKIFNFYMYNLDKLPVLPNGLKELECGYNDIIELPKLPNGLIKLYCCGNRLTELPELPSRLIRLACYNNKLTELPELPDGLEELYCYNNNLSELPELSNGLTRLYCDHNPIKYITPDMYSIMRNIYLKNINNILISNTIFYDNSGCSSKAEFLGIE
jgi:Leucine-rich repeat (LRR) protein